MKSMPCSQSLVKSQRNTLQLQLYLPGNILEFYKIWTSVWNWSIVASWEKEISQLKIVSSFCIECSLEHEGSSHAVNSYWSMADVADISAGEKLHYCAFKYIVILSWPLHQNPNKLYPCFYPSKPFSTHFISPHGAAGRLVSPFHSLRVDSHILSDTECNTHTLWYGFMFVLGKGKWGRAETTVEWRDHKCLILDGDFGLCWKPTNLLFATVVEEFT